MDHGGVDIPKLKLTLNRLMPSNICRSDNSLELLERSHQKPDHRHKNTHFSVCTVEQSHQYLSHEEWCLYQLCVVGEWNRREHIHHNNSGNVIDSKSKANQRWHKITGENLSLLDDEQNS